MPSVWHFREQKYCCKPECCAASKKASQRKWLMSEKGAEYRDPEENMRRVREWRKEHPFYWRHTAKKPGIALQDTTKLQHPDNERVTASLNRCALQDMNFLQPALVVGLMAQLTGSALQDTIAETTERLLLLGLDILGTRPGTNPKGGRDEGETYYMPREVAAGAAAV